MGARQRDADYMLWREEVANRSKHWVRAVTACNSRCTFCLDTDTPRNVYLPEEEVKAELRRAGVEHIDAGEIRRQQVTGEADALEGQGPSPGQGLGQGGFAHPRPVLNQKMASGQQTGERQAHLLLLAQQHLRDGLHQPWQCWIKQGTHPRAQPLTFTLILERKWLAGIGTV